MPCLVQNTSVTCLCRRVLAAAPEEDVQVELPEQFLEDLDAGQDALEAAQLGQALTACHDATANELYNSVTGERISFTELLLSDQFDLQAPTWQPGHVPVPVSISSQLVGLTPMSSSGPRIVTRGLA